MSNAPRPLYGTTVKLSQNHSMISTAYHEAGHAVCTLLMFGKVSSVFVEKNRRVSGETNFELIDCEYNDIQELHNFVINSEISINYAGMIAEKILYKDITGSTIWPKVLKIGCESDIKRITELIKKNNLSPPGEKRYRLKNKIQRNINKLLLEHWDAIKIIAHALFERNRLVHDDIKYLLIKKSNNPKFWINQFKYINLFIDQNKLIDNKDMKIIFGR